MRRVIGEQPSSVVEDILTESVKREVALGALARIKEASEPTKYPTEIPPRVKIVTAPSTEGGAEVTPQS